MRKQINHLPGRYHQHIQRVIAQLTITPRPAQAKLLRNSANRYRIRVDDYRIVYRIEDAILLIEALKVSQKEGADFYDDVA